MISLVSMRPCSPIPGSQGRRGQWPAPAATLKGALSRYQAYARAGLVRASTELAGLKEGRPSELFRTVCALGWAVAHGVLSEAEFSAAFVNACQQNGLCGRDGHRAIEATIHSGLKCAEHDLLPVLQDREPLSDRETVSASPAASEKARPGQRDRAPGGAADDWGEPEPLPDALPSVAPFDFEFLPESVRAWGRDIAERMQAPPDFVGVAIMASLGAVIGRKLHIRPKGQDDTWCEVCNCWALGIGRPGVLKSPSMEAALAPLKWLEAKAFDEYQRALGEQKASAQVKKLRAAARLREAKATLKQNADADISTYLDDDEEEQIALRRYSTNNSSPEALAALHVGQPNGLLVYRDELVSLLQTLDREEGANGRAFYLTGWGGNSPWTTDRIGRGFHHRIDAVCLSVLGSTQPAKIARYVAAAKTGGAGDDGLLQRFGLTVWPDVSPHWHDIDRDLDVAAKRRAYAVFKRLDELNPKDIGASQDSWDGKADGLPYLRFDAEALAAFKEWHSSLEHRLRSGELHPALESHLAKYRKLVPALALITHLANAGTDAAVTLDALLCAIAWAEYLETHARRLYAAATMPQADIAKGILAKVKDGALGIPFTARDITQRSWSKLSDPDDVGKGLALLVDFGWLRETTLKTGRAPHRVHGEPAGATVSALNASNCCGHKEAAKLNPSKGSKPSKAQMKGLLNVLKVHLKTLFSIIL